MQEPQRYGGGGNETAENPSPNIVSQAMPIGDGASVAATHPSNQPNNSTEIRRHSNEMKTITQAMQMSRASIQSLKSLADEDGWGEWGTSEWKPVNEAADSETRMDKGFPDSTYLVELPSHSEFVPFTGAGSEPATPPTSMNKLLSIQKQAQVIQGEQDNFTVRSNSIQGVESVPGRAPSYLRRQSTASTIPREDIMPAGGGVGRTSLRRRDSELSSIDGGGATSSEIEILVKENKALKQQCENLIESKDLSRRRSESLESQIQELIAEVATLKHTLKTEAANSESKRREIQQLRDALSQAEDGSRSTQMELTRITTGLADAERALSEQRRDGEARIKDFQLVMVRRENEHDHTVSMLKNELDEGAKRCGFLEEQLQKRQQDAEEDAKARAKLLDDCTNQSAELQKMDARVRGLEHACASQENMLADRDAEILSLRHQIDTITQLCERQGETLRAFRDSHRKASLASQNGVPRAWPPESKAGSAFDHRQSTHPYGYQPPVPRAADGFQSGSMRAAGEPTTPPHTQRWRRHNDDPPPTKPSVHQSVSLSLGRRLGENDDHYRSEKTAEPWANRPSNPANRYPASTSSMATPPRPQPQGILKPTDYLGASSSSQHRRPSGSTSNSAVFSGGINLPQPGNSGSRPDRKDILGSYPGLGPGRPSPPGTVAGSRDNIGRETRSGGGRNQNMNSMEMEKRLMDLSLERDRLENQQAKLARKGARKRAEIIEKRDTAERLENVRKEINKLRLGLRRLNAL
mmetsp:Transcript_30452/g.51461  ORF Transcript_30452/g.51461 Transcript_30452/m.51461 type:complete len:753 (-) Transcript_30452:209-2467(-)